MQHSNINYTKNFSFEKEIGENTVYATIEVTLEEKRQGLVLTISGSYKTPEWVHYGQCIGVIYTNFPDNDKIRRIYEVWKRWHLNDLHAGCIHQREFEKEPYEKHRGCHCDICNYTYGHAWIFEEIPKEVIEEIKSW